MALFKCIPIASDSIPPVCVLTYFEFDFYFFNFACDTNFAPSANAASRSFPNCSSLCFFFFASSKTVMWYFA